MAKYLKTDSTQILFRYTVNFSAFTQFYYKKCETFGEFIVPGNNNYIVIQKGRTSL